MKYISILIIFLFSFAQSKYLDNYSCQECHEKIYDEYNASQHSKTYFNDELHRKIADAVSETKYDCAVCHMPMADNIQALINGEARPNINNKTHSDGVSCYFCHTIAYVKKSHRFNVNIKSRQAEGYKPTLYGRLHDPDDSDKHSSITNPVYAKNVCKGCHSHKLNENNVTIFSAMQNKQDSLSCIKCHMPEIEGGAEKMDKRARGQHASHKFLGIHDKEFRATGMDINVSVKNDKLSLILHNKTTHPLIIQAARAKFFKIEITRDAKTIWQNYIEDPREDAQAYFGSNFKKDGKKIIIPATATEGSANNIGGEETRELTYTIPPLQKGDKISVTMYVQLAKTACIGTIELDDSSLTEPALMQHIEKIW